MGNLDHTLATRLSNATSVDTWHSAQDSDLDSPPHSPPLSPPLSPKEATLGPNGSTSFASARHPEGSPRLVTNTASRANRVANAELALNHARVGTYRLDLATDRVFGDARYASLLGLPPDSGPNAEGLPLAIFLERIDQPDRRLYELTLKDIRQGRADLLELCVLVRPDGRDAIPVLDRARATREHDRLVLTGAQIDLTGFVAPVDQLRHLMTHDQLTGLPNRHGIWRQVEQVHQETQLNQAPCALALLDIDHFKEVNDRHGPSVGDQLLADLAMRLDARLRPQGIAIGRWDGDAFLALAPDLDETTLTRAIDDARQHIADQPATVADQPVPVTFSAGVAAIPRLMDSPEQVLARADIALHRARKDGSNRVYGCAAAADSQTMSLAILVQDAVRMARVTPVFQPLVRLADRQPMAEEAFARIRDNNSRLLNAGAFIEVALQLKLLHRIDRMLFEAAVERLLYPPEKAVTTPNTAGPATIFAHVSEDLIRHPATLSEMVQHLDKPANPQAARALVLVVSADLASERTAMVASALQPLLRLGCKLSVSGFGARGGSVGQLGKDLPISYLSFDPTLMQGALESDRAASILANAQSQARTLGILTIAKQIQNPDTLALAKDLGIDWGQGYLLGAPTDPAWPLSARSGAQTAAG